jgi:hypothetical protein
VAIRNNDWYNLNEQRDYPVDDTASALADNGGRLPSALITDLQLRWPSSLGQYAYISAASVTSSIVTAMIEVSKTKNNVPDTAVLIAGVSIPKAELQQRRTYSLVGFEDGVAGFISFGSGTEEPFVGKFSTPEQSLLTARAARLLREPPIPSIKVNQAATALTGLVNFRVATPLQASKETRVIQGVEYDNVIVVRLAENDTATATDSVYAKFAGDCGRRVGSRTCTDPQPVETVNGILPDCDGVLTLDFRGCAVIGTNVADCGVVLDCNLGLSASCDPPNLPNLETGKLPSELDPIIIPPVIPPEPPVGPDVSISESAITILSLPYCDTFDDGVAYGFNLVGTSVFGFIADDSPSEDDCCLGPPAAVSNPGDGCTTSQSISNSESHSWDVVPILEVDASYGPLSAASQARTNLSLFASDVQCLFRKYTTDVKITPGVTGSQRNAGLALNYRTTSDGLSQYFVALLNTADSLFGFYYFNGATLTQLSEAQVNDVREDDWYRITLTAVPDTITQTSVNITATLDGITDPSIAVILNVNISSNTFGNDSGLAGLYARRSRSYFSFWRIDEASP